ncbi:MULTISPECIES: pyruvate kinase [Thauera]|jgi:pyruvate kinase|uniref:Pyruvate kinase n=2 Tax=Thauera aminoaromatica TaxID=164330 RepID=C4ZLZ8_THASP|nr:MULTISPECIES: pyruvate kinase [Thauera]MDA0235425.1 pyruvate kinase [Pseudomonadota bacterium]ACK54053.1 pyruvate kinase [Thauera aminoaromatica]ENO86673.1 pyruvate kinase [Thauera aminoaromatica S2]KIN92086.1 pyruvate kinase [Thauera sp. SWB20]MCK6397786.1 pyruvate kinase [Thauera aminoaromatica]
MKRERSARILATLGPASSTRERIRALAEAGADVFRLNFSHGSHEDHAERYRLIRAVEAEIGRPIGVLMDLQGPKLRVGRFAEGKVALVPGARFRLDLDPTAGDAKRANLPHPEIFAALEAGTELLLDDGKLRLRVDACGADFADTTVLVGGTLSDRKGVNVPGVVLPISPLTAKDRADLDFGLALGVDWVALSFVQRPEDLREARELIGDRAWIMAKLEKPAAIDALDAIIALADGVMVARGDLGVELPPQQVPVLQRRIVRAARAAGRPVVVATQMLESMISSPVPTRAEASDVATAIYDGADAVMLSAESASGQYPVEAVAIMHGIVCEVERDPAWRAGLEASHTAAAANTPDAICCALRRVAGLLEPAATVAYTSSGFSALRASRERPVAPILALTPQPATARRLALVWGVHAVPFEEVHDVAEMVEHAARAASTLGFGCAGDAVVVIAGLPFGQRGSTNLLHVARIPG